MKYGEEVVVMKVEIKIFDNTRKGPDRIFVTTREMEEGVGRKGLKAHNPEGETISFDAVSSGPGNLKCFIREYGRRIRFLFNNLKYLQQRKSSIVQDTQTGRFTRTNLVVAATKKQQ